ISAPFWLPALALDSAVTWLASPQPAAFRVSAWEFLAPVRVASGTPQFTLGWVLPLLVGLAWLGRWRGAAAWPLLTVGTAGVLVAWVGCVVSPAPVWLSMGTLAAVLAGAGGLRWLHDSLKPERRRWGYISAALSIVALSLSVFPSAGGAVTVEFSASAQLRYEQRTRTPAVLPSGRAIPSALPALAPANRLLLNDYDTPAFNRIPLNAGARMSVLEQRSHRLVWQVGTTQPVTLTVLVAAYPAWQAALDGQALPTARTTDGLLSVRVPPVANGTLVVWHGWVPEHALAWLTVMLTALGMAVYLRTR
nr:hypothetical protein [Anaerolineae bacterium]